jgi:group II intron reverse transcriptase/maturase
VADKANARSGTKLGPEAKLALVADKARKNPKEQFNNLLHHLTSKLIEGELNQMKRTTSAGVDGMTVAQAKDHLDWLLPKVLEQIHEGSYKPPPVRRVYIPKGNGGERPLGVPTVLDRAAQAAAVRVLEQIYEQDFIKCSFGFRPKLSCHHAVATAGAWIKAYRLDHVLEVDLRDFFGSINHEWLMKFLRLRINDERMLKLIEGWLKAGVLEDGKWQISETGTPQGGSISPLLANIYLHYVLDLWWEKKIKKRLKGRAELVRYADDFVLLFRNESDAKELLTLLKVRLAQFGLAINEDKTHLTDVTPRERVGTERRSIAFLGFSIFYTQNRARRGWKLVYQTDRKRMSRALTTVTAKMRLWMHEPIHQQARRINRVLQGHFNYYGMPGNLRKLDAFEYAVRRYWRQCLSRRSQNGKMTWDKMNSVLQKHPLAKARIRLTYPILDTYSVLQ